MKYQQINIHTKKFSYLFATILVMSIVGCTTETVENTINTTPQTFSLDVSISNPKTKVEIGGKGSDGKYFMYWSDGDQLSVNGYLSNPVTINEDNPCSANYKFEGAILNPPYNFLYPASADNTVVIPAAQNYAEGTFEAGTMPLYASVTTIGGQVQLNHIAGILRFTILGSNETTTLESMAITAEKGSIAGTFTMDFENKTLIPTESVSSTIEYSFGGGLPLAQTAEESKSFFVVLPTGDFGMCAVELRTTNGGVMLVRFNTSSSNIKAGIVREFKPIAFKHGVESMLTSFEVEEGDLGIDDTSYSKAPTTIDGEWLVINDVSEFIWLCSHQPYLNNTEYRKIRIGADIEMGMYSALRLHAMKLYEDTEIDGNGKSITGVNMSKDASSIFGDNKNLNIHDLTLVDCTVNTTLQTGAAILVGKADEGLTVSDVTFNNCSVVAPRKIGLVAGAMHTGTFSVSGVTADSECLVETSYVSGKSGLAGGLIGCYAKNGDGATTSTATFTNCTTSATVKSYMEASNYFYGKMVGQLGGYNNDEKLYFVNCDGTNATLVPMYDKGTTNAKTAVLSFCEAHRADWCQTTLTAATDNLLGGERYCRGMVYYDGNRFMPEWDGKRSATMLTEVVDGITRYLVYSPFDLAKAQGTSYDSTKAVIFKTSVDMGGHTFKPINYVRNLDGGGFTLHNLKVVRTHDATNNRGAGFIVYASGATVHKNLTFVGADITCNHDATIAPLEYGNDDDGGAGNAYAGVLVSRTATGANPYTASNIHVKDSKVRGVCKVGGLIGNMYNTNTGIMTVENCSIDNTTIENYDPKVWNYYKMYREIDASLLGNYIAEGLQWWYTAGECGGLIVFVSAKTANITNCSVTNCNINCTGQEDKDVTVNIFKADNYVANAYTSGASTFMLAHTTIAGRHINQFIGDIRSQRSEAQQEAGSGEYTTIITDYTVSGNKYNGVAADSTNDYNHEYASGTYCPAVGCAYYTGVDMKIFTTIHVQHCAGTLTFNAKGGSSTTLTEAIGSGDGMAWFGGNGSTSTGTSYYPAAPTAE